MDIALGILIGGLIVLAVALNLDDFIRIWKGFFLGGYDFLTRWMRRRR